MTPVLKRDADDAPARRSPLRLDGPTRKLALGCAAVGVLVALSVVATIWLLRSLASELGAEAAAVVLTGMGRDGADGLAAVAAAGGETFAQDEASAAVFGMPREAAERGAAHVLDPRTIGSTLATLHKVGVRA